ncbi:hypothetical protein EVG20_g5101 [Dentipellis fragilis]|uniref:Uncharacterized protein n=1 Tax=Dentipellis fragilis TaxID=205917 RepID=A0A4Y9YUB2_9AGAM|nr:hypothetical protein EVG20_g5101 [Dentipellis fragilis]
MAGGFLGIFGKRDKSRSPRKNHAESQDAWQEPPPSSGKSQRSTSVADTSERDIDDSGLSVETDYVLADPNSPAMRNSVYQFDSPSSASSTKLKMPFGRRKQSNPNMVASSSKQNLNDNSLRVPQSSYMSTASPRDDLLRPPPSRSAIFGSYDDPQNALSTRSLPPNDYKRAASLDAARAYETMSNPDPHTTTPAKPTSPKKTKDHHGLFAWARSRDRSKPKPPPQVSLDPIAPPLNDSSFNLKSFRHVNASPSTSPLPETPALVPRPLCAPRKTTAPRRELRERLVPADIGRRVPRGTGAPQRCSLAHTLQPCDSNPPRGRQRSSTVGSPSASVPPVSRATAQAIARASASASRLFSDSDSSESSDELEDSESEAEETLRPGRRGTITQRTTRNAQSELGHRSPASQKLSSPFGSPSPSMALPPAAARDTSTSASTQPSPSQTSPKVPLRERASASASALVPDAAARRATEAASKMPPRVSPTITRPRPRLNSSSSTSSDSSSSDDSDDAPLAALMPPPRPGSAVSTASSGRRPAKPLIDINELTGHRPMPMPRRTIDNSDLRPPAVEAEKPPPLPAKDIDKDKDKPMQQQQRHNARSYSLGLGERLAALTSGVAASAHHPHTSKTSPSDIAQPALKTASGPPRLDLKLDASGSPPSSPKSPSSLPYTQSPTSAVSENAAPIVPTPIRERHSPPSFAVTSRPISHASSASMSTITGLDQIVSKANEAKAKAKEAKAVEQPTVRVVKSPPRTSSRGLTLEDPPLPKPQLQPLKASTHPRPPTTTLVSRIPKNDVTGTKTSVPPPRPFTGLLRDNSPASSTGDSSSGKLPPTPRDGSELGIPPALAGQGYERGRESSNVKKRPQFDKQQGWTSTPSVVSTTANGSPTAYRHRKRASVTFMETQEAERERKKSLGASTSASASEESERERARVAESRRKERRREEAKASIELGRVVNGKGPIQEVEDEDPMTGGPRMNPMSMYGGNPPVPFPASASTLGVPYQSASAPPAQFSSMPNMGMGMNMPMNMGMGMQQPMDPMMLAAHQHAMMIAKQTYQYAVAQQAMQSAADEWERGSSVSGWGGGRAPSVIGGGLNVPMNGMPVNNMGMGMYPMGMGGGMGMGWPNGGMMYPQAARSMYAGSAYAPSEIGGGSQWGGSQWGGTRSVYGENFGPSPSADRSSRAFRQSHAPPVPAMPPGSAMGGGGQRREGPRARTKTAPSGTAPAVGPAGRRPGPNPQQGQGLLGTVSPPSSWKPPS